MKRTDAQRTEEFRASMAHYLGTLAGKRDFAAVVSFYEDNRMEIDACDAGILRHVARAYASQGSYPTALRIARAAQTRAAREGDTIDLAEMFTTLGGILRDMGEMREAEKAYRDAESIFRRHDNLEGQSRALNLLAGIFYRQNDYTNALSVLLDAIEIARKLDDSKKLAFMTGNIGRIYLFLGRFDEARKHLLTSLELSRSLQDYTELGRICLSLGFLNLQEGHYAQAEIDLTEANCYLVNHGSRWDKTNYLLYMGELQYRSGRLNDALETLEAAHRLAEKTAPDTELVVRALRHLAEVELRLNRVRRAERFVAKGIALANKCEADVEQASLLKIKAICADRNGDAKQAAEWFRVAIDNLEDTGVRFEQAAVLVEAGRSEVFTQRQRLTFLFRAEEFYTRAGIRNNLGAVEQLIASIDLPDSPMSSAEADARAAENNSEFVTASEEIKRFKAQLPIVGRSDLPILLTGETGVGKDQMARYFHSVVRPDGPFVAINCASLPETLLESELFGHTKGAFTGADGDKQGRFVAANGGVLFLDEIGDMPLSLQTKLLGVLERRKVLPLGSTTEVDLDVKLVAATNQRLEEMVENGRFRRDLYYRLSGISFTLPPLRDRKQDIPLLLEHFFGRSRKARNGHPAELSTELVRQFVSYDWPGNVRELSTKVKRIEVLSELAAEGDLTELARGLFPDQATLPTLELNRRVEEYERKLIIEALTTARGNKSEAARLLGIHEATVRTKLKRYGINLDGGSVN